jgi:predicted phosphate transport protein (TIGR00153 family)
MPHRFSLDLRELLIPQEKIFFELLEQESKNVLAGALALDELLHNFDQLADKRNKIKDIEHEGDNIVHSIYDRLIKTFITPIDREDISKLASLYDDVLDYIYAAVNRLYLYEISSPTEPMRRFTELVVKSVREIDFAFASIQKIKAPEVESRIIEVDRLENEADVVLNEAVAALFKTNDAITIIKLKEIYELLETITDKCEDVVQVIRDIILEYS